MLPTDGTGLSTLLLIKAIVIIIIILMTTSIIVIIIKIMTATGQQAKLPPASTRTALMAEYRTQSCGQGECANLATLYWQLLFAMAFAKPDR